MENFKFNKGDTVIFKDNRGRVIEGKVIGIKPLGGGYTIEHNGIESMFSKSIV